MVDWVAAGYSSAQRGVRGPDGLAHHGLGHRPSIGPRPLEEEAAALGDAIGTEHLAVEDLGDQTVGQSLGAQGFGSGGDNHLEPSFGRMGLPP